MPHPCRMPAHTPWHEGVARHVPKGGHPVPAQTDAADMAPGEDDYSPDALATSPGAARVTTLWVTLGGPLLVAYLWPPRGMPGGAGVPR
jgi:hypothetical protein